MKHAARWAAERESFLEFVKATGKGKSLEEFCYTLRWKEIGATPENGIRGICRRFGSHTNAVTQLFPELDLLPWKFSTTPKHFWKQKNNQKKFFDWYKEQNNIETPHDWAKPGVLQDIYTHGGRGLVKVEYRGSLSSALRNVYPAEDWSAVFTRSCNFWQNPSNIRKRMALGASSVGVRVPSDWLSVTAKQFYSIGFSYPMNLYGGKDNMILVAYPELKEEAEQRKPTSWRDVEQLKTFLEYVKSKYDVNTNEDWYKVTRKQIISEGGVGMFKHYRSLPDALAVIYPEHEWKQHTNTSTTPFRYWDDQRNVREFMDRIKEKYDFRTPEDWYSSLQIIQKEGSSHVVQRHGGLVELLKVAYPEETWPEIRKPDGYWDNPENVIAIVKKIENDLSLNKLEDWYRVSRKQINDNGGGTPLRYFGILKMLQMTYPSIGWDENLLLRRNKKATQFLLRKRIEQLYPNNEIFEDYRHPQIQFKESQQLGELDLFLPEMNLAFEYNGEQHYHDNPAFGPVELYKLRDKEKEQACKELGITLVIVPYWWDEEVSSLVDLIVAQDPALDPSKL